VLLLAWVPLRRHYLPELTWYWAISWEHGFVRRGLCGEVAGLLPAGDLESAAQLLTGLSASVATASLATVALVRLLRGDPVSVALGLALLAGPVGVIMLWHDPRPEYFGYPAFLLVMAACRCRSAGQTVMVRCWLGLAAALLAVVTLASENVLFAVLPWCVVLLTVTTVGAPLAERVRLVIGFVALPGVAAAAVLLGGRADAAQLALLREDAARLDGEPVDFMRFVGQDLGQSLSMVVHSGVGHRMSMVLVAVAIVAVLVAVLLVCGVRREWSRLPVDRLVVLSLGLPVAGLLFQGATGLDWPRWVGQVACGALLTLTCWGVLVPDPGPARWRPPLVGGVALCFSALLLVPAVPYNIVPGAFPQFVASRIS
jgi:hypothetical protein